MNKRSRCSLDSRLNSETHTDLVVTKAHFLLGFVIVDQSAAVYLAFVQSNLDNASTWLTIPAIKFIMIVNMQHKFTMFGLLEYPNVSNNYQISP